MDLDLGSIVCEILGSANGTWTSTEIGERLRLKHSIDIEKIKLNELLHQMKKDRVVICNAEIPPTWQLVVVDPYPRDENRSSPPIIHCVIDLGNTHDCLQNLLPYAQRGILSVCAYADMAFRGYGISPSISIANVQVFQADTPDKNSADVQIIWDICRFVERLEQECPERQCFIYIATKDLGFMRVKHLVERNSKHTVTFVTNWQALRMYIE